MVGISVYVTPQSLFYITTSVRKNCNFTGYRDHINKKYRKKGGSLHLQIF